MSTFWYPQFARPLPRSGRIPRSMYNTPTHDSNGPVERVSIAMPTIEPEPTFFKSYGVHAIISILLLGLAALTACGLFTPSFYWNVSYYDAHSSELFVSGFFVALSAAFFFIPAFLFWRQRARRRVFDAMPVEPKNPDRDSFFY